MAKKRQGDPSKAVGLVRVSSEDQSLGPQAQVQALERWAATNNITLVEIFHENVSGAASLDKRPQLLAAIDCLKLEGAGLLVALRRDRLARDVVIAAMIERLVEQAGARVATVDGVGEGNTPEAMLLKGMIDLISSYERALIRSRTTQALAVKKRRNELVGTAPFGSRVAADGIKLEPHPAEQKVVSLVKQLRQEGLTMAGIADRLNFDQVKSRGSRWHKTSVVRLLKRAAA
jgi:DNA invertase Pin-like site-specific DNA recombinase